MRLLVCRDLTPTFADTITSLKLSPDGNNVLSNAMDNTSMYRVPCFISCDHWNAVRSWNVRPFAATDRLEKVFVGAQHNFEKNLIKVCPNPEPVCVTMTCSSAVIAFVLRCTHQSRAGGVDARRSTHWRRLLRSVCAHMLAPF